MAYFVSVSLMDNELKTSSHRKVKYHGYRVNMLINHNLLLLSFGDGCARPGESENTLSVQRPQPPQNQPMEGRNR